MSAQQQQSLHHFRCTFVALFFFLAFQECSIAQCAGTISSNCMAVPTSEMVLATESGLNFSFTDFTQYNAGITLTGATRLRLNVVPNNASCKWSLRVYIENNPASGTPTDEWESLSNYGNTASVPTIDLLSLRVYNGCGTPIGGGVYQNFQPINGAYIDIINDTDLTPSGSCTTNVNGAGSYVTNYNEYTFNIDYRIVPGLNWSPGTYQLNLHFCLVEQP